MNQPELFENTPADFCKPPGWWQIVNGSSGGGWTFRMPSDWGLRRAIFGRYSQDRMSSM
ncbi:hypothetical protein [Rhizobium sp. PL01]|uniref:hypothetical protein n=1 Tax=Rhizobium sp. PL01 TaxID=3085631 RepID=UPI002981C358|nr:hypothetical protein [Rhizobium sp. PL01]MDW5316834.1 hypothetical protein [Rhizobium sp. PL01]